MKCPYVLSEETVTQTSIEYNDDEQAKVYLEVQHSKPAMTNCIGKECGAFYDGRCHYRN